MLSSTISRAILIALQRLELQVFDLISKNMQRKMTNSLQIDVFNMLATDLSRNKMAAVQNIVVQQREN